jgi:[acyl-carrier-protein] S-malonyltransferase
MTKRKIVLVCPGRGTYNASELGYLHRYHGKNLSQLQTIESLRRSIGQTSLLKLDQAKHFDLDLHTKGENAAALIYACAYLDFLAIDQNQFEVVAITGNSMGWYLALAFGQSLNENAAALLINTMGSMLKDHLMGGQIIYPLYQDNWQLDEKIKKDVFDLIDQTNQQPGHECSPSIYFGNFLVIGGNELAMKFLLKTLPPKENRYPMLLKNNGPFHTLLCREISHKAKELLPVSLFSNPKTPLIDGQGQLWHPKSTSLPKLWDYTLGHQVTRPYDFTLALSLSLKEFAPDHLVLLGPGSTMGGAIGQTLVQLKWRGVNTKSDFIKQQKDNPFLISTGIDHQRSLILR